MQKKRAGEGRAVEADRADPTMLAAYQVRPTAATDARVSQFPQKATLRSDGDPGLARA